MWDDFKTFLIKQNALALAIGVVVGAALNDVVKGIVDNVIMPVVGAATPGGAWRTATLPVGPVSFGVGPLAAVLLNFVIVGLVAWRLSKAFIRPEPQKSTKECPFCQMADLDARATRCPHCTSQLADGAAGAAPGAPTASAAVAR